MKRWAGAIIVVGSALALRGYLQNWSLWLDELLVAQQIIDRSFAGLTEQLKNGQNAPIGWLWAVKAAITGLGSSEYGLRLIPLLSGVAALPIAWLAMRRIVGPSAALVALAGLALAWPTSAYAATVKQYSTDVLVTALILWAAALAAGPPRSAFRGGGGEMGQMPENKAGDADPRRKTHAAYLPLAAVGVIVQWFSHPAVFMLGGVGLTLLIAEAARKRWGRLLALATIAAVWLAVFAANYFMFLRLDPTWEWAWLHAHWEQRGGYLPWSSGPLAAALWLPRALADVMCLATGLPGFAWAALAIAILGAARLWRANRLALGFCTLPLALTALAGAIHRYPLADRLTLFLAPAMTMLLGAAAIWGFEELRRRSRQRLAWAAPAVVVGPIALSAAAWAIWPWMPSIEHTRPLVRELGQAHKPGDPVVVNYWTQHAWRYYAPRFGLGDVQPIVAPREDEAPMKPGFGRSLAPLDGEASVWLLLTHYAEHPWDRPTEYSRHADRLGHLVTRQQAPGACLLRYDFHAPEARNPRPAEQP